MKKCLATLGVILLISACAGKKEEAAPAVVVVPMVEVKEKNVFVNKDVTEKYASNYERLVTNVLVKDKTPSSVTYEYKDVRIDEIGLLASRYCFEHGHGGAILKEAFMHKNFSRRATFDCVVLQ